MSLFIHRHGCHVSLFITLLFLFYGVPILTFRPAWFNKEIITRFKKKGMSKAT